MASWFSAISDNREVFEKKCGEFEDGRGSFAPAGVVSKRAEQYQGKVTTYVIIACIVADIGGSIFGYDIGISGTFISLS